jgi:hypothetical protein
MVITEALLASKASEQSLSCVWMGTISLWVCLAMSLDVQLSSYYFIFFIGDDLKV